MNFTDYYTDAKVAELKAAFDLVAPKDNWKMPIDITLHATDAEVAVIKEAITFYTGSVATVTALMGAIGWVRITAAGYYVAIGA